MHSSHTMIFALASSCALADPLEMSQEGYSLVARSRGSLNVEWAVLPPWRSVAAIPEDATASAMSPRDRNFASIKLRR